MSSESQRPQPASRTPTLSSHHPNSAHPHKNQHQSALFSRLPAEIRNTIYTHVFTTSSAPFASPAPTPHALSLLSTCRRMHHEAAILAFKTYTFPLHPSTAPTYLALQSRTSHLPPTHLSAITSLSVLPRGSNAAAALLANALLVFPQLSRFNIAISLPLRPDHYVSTERYRMLTQHRLSRTPGAPSRAADPHARAVERYAPRLLTHTLHTATSGTAHAWQSGQKWCVTWPQAESGECYSKIECEDGRVTEELVMECSAVGAVEGVHMCVCGCGNVAWTGAVLVQETGRRVRVEIGYGDRREVDAKSDRREVDAKSDRRELDAQMPSVQCVGVVLIPGTLPARGAVRSGAGFGYDADSAYWAALRRRNEPWWNRRVRHKGPEV